MDQRGRDIVKLGNSLFDKKREVDSLWQEIALNFYPERADFTTKRNMGDEYADHLFTSFPVQARRELGNMLSAGLRPRSQKWFSLHVDDEEVDEGAAERQWLERISDIQWRAMYDPAANFVRSTKQADHDFVTFGNAVLKIGMNKTRDTLLFNNYHLRDNVWTENAEGRIDVNHRNWEPTARQLVAYFGDKCSSDVKRAAQKDPEKTFKCRHVVMPERMYELKDGKRKYPFTSFYVECDSETTLEEVGLNYFCYVIPRWHTIDGSPFAVSMATSILIPDGRTMQVVIRTLREASEKYADPPMIAIGDAIRGDIALYAGGVTTADAEYDERLGEVLRPITQNSSGMPPAFEVAAALREDIRAGFFLDKLQLPEVGKDMTAFEVQRRLEEHIRGQAPIYEPIEQDYNDPVCETVFQVLRDGGAFPVNEMPESLDGMRTHFSFRSPLADMAEAREAESYIDVVNRILAPAAQIDPAQLENADFTAATRDAMRSLGWRAKWFKPEKAVQAKQIEMAKAAQMQQGAMALQAAGTIAEQGGKGMTAMQEAGVA